MCVLWYTLKLGPSLFFEWDILQNLKRGVGGTFGIIPWDLGSSDVSVILSSFGVKSEAQSIEENRFLTIRNLVCISIANNKYPAGEFCLLHLS